MEIEGLNEFQMQEETMELTSDFRLYQEPMAVITKGGNELMNSYNKVTDNLLNEVNRLENRLREQTCELFDVRRENERLLARIHDLSVVSELREEAFEASRSQDGNGTAIIELELQGNDKYCYFGDKKNKASWLKIALLFGFTVSLSVAIRNGIDV